MRTLLSDPTSDLDRQPTQEQILKWQRLTSFAARLTGAGFTRWVNWPVNEVSHALGRPREKGTRFDCNLWIATEWLLRAADATYGELRECEDIFEERRPVAPSVQKWRAWRQRLVELEQNYDKWDFKDTTLERIRQAIQEMDIAEQGHILIEEE